MAFTATVQEKTVFGNKRIHKGTFVNDGGSTGGDITTGLQNCDALILIPVGSSVHTNAPVVNETTPVAGGVMTIVTDANVSGDFIAIGV